GQQAAAVLGLLVELVRNGVAGAALAGARRVTALQHLQALDAEPVARRAVVVTLLDQADHAVHRARRQRTVHLHADLARGGVERDVHLAGRGGLGVLGQVDVLGRFLARLGVLARGRVVERLRLRDRLHPLGRDLQLADHLVRDLLRLVQLLLFLRLAFRGGLGLPRRLGPGFLPRLVDEHQYEGDHGDHRHPDGTRGDDPIALRPSCPGLDLAFQLALRGFAALLVRRHRPSWVVVADGVFGRILGCAGVKPSCRSPGLARSATTGTLAACLWWGFRPERFRPIATWWPPTPGRTA